MKKVMKLSIIFIVFTFLLSCKTTTLPKIDGYNNCLNAPGNCWGISFIRGGEKYTGQHIHGVRQGKGTLLYSNGNKYIGNFINNEKNGYGTFYAVEAAEFNGWKQYVGYWKNNHPYGQGKATYPDGKTEMGEFLGYTLMEDEKGNKNQTITKIENVTVKKAKEECVDLGFKDKSEKFGECVMELIK